MTNLRALSYTSSAVGHPTARQLWALLCRARQRNQVEQVSGVLLYSKGTFHQYIEGPALGVQRVYEAICRDPLHHQLFELINESIDRREFGHWQMGYVGDLLVEDTVDRAALCAILADESAKLIPGRLLLNAFWTHRQLGR